MMKWLSLGRKKLVYDSHEYAINDIPNESRWSIRLKFALEVSFIRFADRVITVSNGIAEEYVRLYGIDKPDIILNAPPYAEAGANNLFRETFDIPTDKRIFLYQGGLGYGRGIELILEAFENLEKTNNVIVFMGDGPLEMLVRERAARFDNIYYHTAVSQADLLTYTSSADIGILYYENTCLNHDYCSPNKMFEYLMAEIPVIVSNLTEMKRLVESSGIGIVTQDGSQQSLQKAVLDSVQLEVPEILENINRFKKAFNWGVQEEVLIDLYRELEQA